MYSNYIIPQQVQRNTIIDQINFEKDEYYGVENNSPPKEYLSKVMNNQLLSLCEFGKKSCIIDGFYLFISGHEGTSINFKLSKGICILDGNLITQNSEFNFSIDISYVSDKPYHNQLFFGLEYDKTISSYKIIWCFIDSENNKLVSPDGEFEWEDNMLPLQFITFKRKHGILLFSEKDHETNSSAWYQQIDEDFEADLSNYYAETNTDYTLYTVLDNIEKTKSLVPAFSYPRELEINGTKYNFPCYTLLERKMYDVIIEWIRLHSYLYDKPGYVSDNYRERITNETTRVWETIFGSNQKVLTTRV
jgi:hypothetical protein